ncbi:gamma-glutamyl-gamma-aminobutyrate hydrolase family protein [Patulibacter defluvii]|uniref:gamma-glutamyl-gamma-aminobutyrate hydrolase family protein n=1 Tax=Patulibacter defluvii TaxID=3095358 RepID=UPI002A7555F9|nr:gamma-glutamyl-gamma-aminobutyrate hydrolase family protein [Patulibacter sp. DM4]
MPRRPVIGVTAAHEPIRHGVAWQQPAHFTPANYVDGLQRAGARVLLLPVDPRDTADPGPLLDGLDGLVLTGGIDLDPDSYGAERDPRTDPGDRERDAFELALARAAEQRDLPLLAICRGMQIVNAADGGTLIQHLPDVVASDEHRRVPGTLDERNAHPVALVPGSLAARASGAESVAVRSHHHQALDRVADGWTVTGRAEDDVIEAIERPGRRFCLAVQWHPEGDPATRLFDALVRAAAEPGARPAPGAPAAPAPPEPSTPDQQETR